MKSIFLVLITLGVLIGHAPVAAGYDASCHQQRLDQGIAQLDAFSTAGTAAPDSLKQAMLESNSEISRGEAAGEAKDAELKRLGSEISNNPANRAESQRLETESRQVNPSNPEEVRNYQKAKEQFEREKYRQELTAAGSDSAADRAIAHDANVQIESDNLEQRILKTQLSDGIPEMEREKSMNAAADAAVQSPEFANHITIGSGDARRDALAAYGVAETIMSTGDVPDKMEYAVQLGKGPFDTAGQVFADFKGRALTGNMAIEHVDKEFGGVPEAVDVRNNLGPQTRSAVSAEGATGLYKLTKNDQIQQVMHKIYDIYVPPPRAPAAPSQPPANMDKVIATVTTATKEAAKTIQTIIVPEFVGGGGKQKEEN